MEKKNQDAIQYNIMNGLGDKVGELQLPMRDKQTGEMFDRIEQLEEALRKKEMRLEQIKELLKKY